MSKYTKSTAAFVLILLASMTIFFTINSNIAGVKAQDQATVEIIVSMGGTTDPVAGTYNYDDGTEVTLKADANSNYGFMFWNIENDAGAYTSTDNPYTLTVSGGESYGVQPVFQIIVPSSPDIDYNTAAIVVVLAASGGMTDPAPGVYALEDAKQLTLKAIPDSGWQFVNWVISGFPIEDAHGTFSFDPTPKDNPYYVDHGYGNKYYYQPVFAQEGTTPPPGTTPTPTGTPDGLSTDTITIVVVAVVIIVVIIAGLGAYAYRKRGKN